MSVLSGGYYRCFTRMYGLMGFLFFSSITAVTTAITSPYPVVLEKAPIFIALIASLSAVSARQLVLAVKRGVEEAIVATTRLFLEAKRNMSTYSKASVINHVSTYLGSYVGLSQLARAWPAIAAGLGVPIIYIAVGAYLEAYKIAQSVRLTLRELEKGYEGECKAPHPSTAAAVMVATLGLAAPLVGKWLTKLIDCASPASVRKAIPSSVGT
ncbi:MAG: hypothetical protein DSY37_03300 [Hyperthermus sp.]|nr:MAG: hypothetical protein DSY37_03300 [Hyperthermus sp.]